MKTPKDYDKLCVYNVMPTTAITKKAIPGDTLTNIIGKSKRNSKKC